MVTGDKRETAECISIASGMRMANNPSVTIEDITSLSFVISSDKKTRDKFFDTAMNSQCVICYRCSPAQKGDLVKSLK
jgi:magnesium-transporting ATPase (P-type)